MDRLFWGVVLRTVQSALQAAPFIFTGLIIAAVFHRLMGHAATRKMFGSNSLASLAQSWVIGMILPGCSLGVIPIVKQLRSSGIAVGTIFAFALSSPLFDPMSLLYGLTLSKPETIIAFAACSLVVVMVCGGLFDRWYPNTEVDEPEPPMTPYGIRRILAVLVVMMRESVSGTAGLIGLGLLGAGLLSLMLPAGSLQRTMAHDNPWSPLLMTAIAMPAYAIPMTAMGQLGSMFQHGNSIGAAFILLTFGAGMNLGLVVWMWRYYGWRKTAVWFGLMLAFVIAFSYGIERPLYPREIEPADHTHAFDTYCQPFLPGYPPPNGYAAEVWRRVRQETQPHEIIGASFLGLLAMGGVVLRLVDPGHRTEAWLARPAADVARGSGRWDIVLPGPVLALASLGVIVGFSILGCFAYYPAAEESIEELRLANSEATSGAMGEDGTPAEHWIPICQGWNRRLLVGLYLRRGRVSEYVRMKSRIYRDQLEILEHMVEDDDPREERRRQALVAQRAYGNLSQSIRKDVDTQVGSK
jgi:uncharacterized membrane protein YraQ (UPF0718 family)